MVKSIDQANFSLTQKRLQKERKSKNLKQPAAQRPTDAVKKEQDIQKETSKDEIIFNEVTSPMIDVLLKKEKTLHYYNRTEIYPVLFPKFNISTSKDNLNKNEKQQLEKRKRNFQKRCSEVIQILIQYMFVSFEKPYYVLNTDLESVYDNFPWDQINHRQIRISKFGKQEIDQSKVKDLGGKRLNEKARSVLQILAKKLELHLYGVQADSTEDQSTQPNDHSPDLSPYKPQPEQKSEYTYDYSQINSEEDSLILDNERSDNEVSSNLSPQKPQQEQNSECNYYSPRIIFEEDSLILDNESSDTIVQESNNQSYGQFFRISFDESNLNKEDDYPNDESDSIQSNQITCRQPILYSLFDDLVIKSYKVKSPNMFPQGKIDISINDIYMFDEELQFLNFMN